MRPSFFKILKATALAYIFLFFTIGLSVTAFIKEKENLKEKEKLLFNSLSKEVVLRVKARMDAYRQILYAGAGLFNSSKSVEREEWEHFIKTLKIEENFPGIQGVGFSKIIYPHEMDEHIKQIRLEGFKEYEIHPEGKRDLYSSIIYLEPFDERNKRAFGYDMFSEEVRREAMKRAIETGSAAASGKVRLMQENSIDEQAGFLIYIPVYKAGMPINSVQEKQAAIEGFVYAPFRAKNLMNGILGSRYNDISLTIYESTKEQKNILFDSCDSNITQDTLLHETKIDIDGRTWILHIKPLYTFYDKEYLQSAHLILILGLLLSFSLFGVILSLLKTKERAQEIAQKITQKLYISEERLRFALEGSGDGIWDWDLSTNMIYFSKRSKEMLGYDEGESVDELERWKDRIHPDDLESTMDATNRHLKGDTPAFTSITRIKCKDESYRWFLERGVVCSRDANGKATRMVGSHTDITDQKIAQEELKAAKEEAETANAHKSQFLANMSHEIRTPLNAVMGLSEMLFYTKLDVKQSDYIHKIYRSSKMLLGIINDILDYSKMEADKLELEKINFKITDVLSQLSVLFSQSAEEKNLILRFDLKDGVPQIIIGDELRLAQILTNLLSNALKFTQEGEIVLGIELKEKAENRALIHFSLRDTGIGLSKEQIKKLFKPFNQADNSTTRKYGGTGLGLSISKKLVNAMGGELSVESIKGKGSTFSFDIDVEVVSWFDSSTPLKKSSTKEHLKESLPDFRGIRVLLVEDNELNQEVAIAKLKKAGIEVKVANNGKEAFEIFNTDKKSFDLILMDIQMPIMSGYEATELIRGYDKNIPIVALSAAAMIEDKEKAFNAGMNDHLSKPIETDRLYQTIAKWTNSSFTPADELPKKKAEPVVLDLDHLFGLLGENQDVMCNLLANFVSKLQNDYSNLSMLLKNGDSSLGASLHSLKGVSGNMGATRLYTLCIEIEKKYKDGKKEMSKEADELDLEIKELISFISAYILEHPSKEAMPITDEAAIKKLFDDTLEKLKKSILIPHEDQDMLISGLKGKVDALELEKFKESLTEYELQSALEIMQKWKI